MYNLLESTETVRKSSAARGEVSPVTDIASDTNNNNSGVDLNQQYREWKEMMVAATAARDRAEQEKQVRNWAKLLVRCHCILPI